MLIFLEDSVDLFLLVLRRLSFRIQIKYVFVIIHEAEGIIEKGISHLMHLTYGLGKQFLLKLIFYGHLNKLVIRMGVVFC